MASEEKDTNDPDFKVEKSGSAKKERKFLYNKNWEEVPEFRGEKITIFSVKTHFQSWKTQCGNIKIFLSLRFSVKSILHKTAIFEILEVLNFVNLVNFSL